MTSLDATYRFPPALAFSGGYDVVARDGSVGRVERPIFRPGENEPSFLVVQLRGLAGRRRRTVPASFVAAVDEGRRVVRLSVKRRTVLRLPQRLTTRPALAHEDAPTATVTVDALQAPATSHTEIIDRRITNVTHVLTLRGPFLDSDIPSLSELIRGVVRAGARQLVVDVRELESLSPRCLDVLVACAEGLAARDGQLLLACPGLHGGPYYLTTIDSTDLGRLRGLQPGLDAALEG